MTITFLSKLTDSELEDYYKDYKIFWLKHEPKGRLIYYECNCIGTLECIGACLSFIPDE